ncbi:MAG: flagellar hook-basal body complex protein FliE [Planctomycetes bacterium]|nr:flagellar hook-basal body complex protein FliE [Planctomycetota bacterium]
MNPLQSPRMPAFPPPPPAPPGTPAAAQAAPSFKAILLEGIDQVNAMQHSADAAVQQLVTGEEIDPAMVLTTIQKADMSFRLMTQIRNKLVQAYQEVKEMRI